MSDKVVNLPNPAPSPTGRRAGTPPVWRGISLEALESAWLLQQGSGSEDVQAGKVKRSEAATM